MYVHTYIYIYVNRDSTRDEHRDTGLHTILLNRIRYLLGLRKMLTVAHVGVGQPFQAYCGLLGRVLAVLVSTGSSWAPQAKLFVGYGQVYGI